MNSNVKTTWVAKPTAAEIKKPNNWVIEGRANKRICVSTANKITESCFHKVFSTEDWRAGKPLIMGIYSLEMAETLHAYACGLTQEVMTGCSCGSSLTFNMYKEY